MNAKHRSEKAPYVSSPFMVGTDEHVILFLENVYIYITPNGWKLATRDDMESPWNFRNELFQDLIAIPRSLSLTTKDLRHFFENSLLPSPLQSCMPPRCIKTPSQSTATTSASFFVEFDM
jgi:hypothetical protein